MLKFNLDKHPLAFAYSKLLEELIYSNKKYINPKTFMSKNKILV